MSKPAITDFKRLGKALGYSKQGILAAWETETAFRQEILGCILLIPLAIWLGETGVEKALMVGVILLVPLVELINSAIESVVDRFGDERHELFGNAKDMGSAAVLLCIIIAIAVWALVLLA